jgi:hypothetical protein
MAKVTGPLFSIGASGKIADSMVFFAWKGINVVRQWVKPANPQSDSQGYLRTALKAISKWVTAIGNKSVGNSQDSVVYQALTASAPAGLNWNAYGIQSFLDLLQSGGSLVASSLDNLIKDYTTTVVSAARAAFASDATALGLEDFAFGYGYTTNIPAGLQLYFGALACYQNGIVGTAPYTINPISWAASDVNNFKADHTTSV